MISGLSDDCEELRRDAIEEGAIGRNHLCASSCTTSLDWPHRLYDTQSYLLLPGIYDIRHKYQQTRMCFSMQTVRLPCKETVYSENCLCISSRRIVNRNVISRRVVAGQQ